MHTSKHVRKRQNQRGISDAMLELAVIHGTPANDKYILGRKEINARLEEMVVEKRTLLKALDKGGVVAVEVDNTLVTAYNFSHRPRK